MEELKSEEGEEGGEASQDDQAEKLHFHGGKLNQVFDEGLGAEQQIETVMSAHKDYCHLCYVMIACPHLLQMQLTDIFAHTLTETPPIIRMIEHTPKRCQRQVQYVYSAETSSPCANRIMSTSERLNPVCVSLSKLSSVSNK